MGLTELEAGANISAEDAGEKKRTLARERFRLRLLDGTLKAGSTLTQNELANILGVSLTPLRELLVLLEDYRLIEVKQRAGITIIYPDVSFIRENLQFRTILELDAIESFALNADQSWVDEQVERHQSIRAELRDNPEAANRGSTETFDRPFHRAMIRSLGNETITTTYERIMDNVTLAQLVHRRRYSAEQITDTIDEHLIVLDKIAARDPDGARTALRAHFRSSTHRIIGG